MRALILLFALAAAACSSQAPHRAADAVNDTTQGASQALVDPVEDAQTRIAEILAPTLNAVQDQATVVVEALPAPTPLSERKGVDPAAIALIVRWEVTSPAHYARRLQGVICPGGASGPTWGIGWDGGHQSVQANRKAWSMRSDVDRLAATSGAVGPAACARARAVLRDVRVTLQQAQQVFADVMLPTYHRATLRAYPGIQAIGARPEGAMVSNVFNRGGSMVGSRAREKRHIRDVCVPAGDAACIAAQLRASCRLWRGTPNEAGLCGRRESEAALAESRA